MRSYLGILLLGIAGLALIPSPSHAQEREAPSKNYISINGSDTMVILGQKWAENYMNLHEGVSIAVTGGGSGTGIAALLNGTADIAQSSRDMKPKEVMEFLKQHKTRPEEIPVALDAVSVYINETNPIESLTLEQLKAIYTGKVTNYREVGGPDLRIVTYGRENNSGTYVYFKEEVLEGADFAQDVKVLPGTAAVINAVAKDSSGIGYGGVAYAKGVRAIPISPSAEAEPVEPTAQNVFSGDYPLARPLFFYINPKTVSKEARAYINWVLSDQGQAVVKNVGYFPLTQKVMSGDEKQEPTTQPTRAE